MPAPFLKVAARYLLVAALAPVVTESGVRAEEWLRYGVPVTSGVTSLADLQVSDSLGHHGRAGARYRQFHINAQGFRGSLVDTLLDDGAPIIAISGSSETFGLFETPGQDWPTLLSNELATRCTPAPHTLNAAIAGMSLLAVHTDIARRLSRFRPHMLVYYPQPTQYAYGVLPRAPIPSSPSPALSPWRPRSLPRLRNSLKDLTPTKLLDILRTRDLESQRSGGEVPFSKVPLERLDVFERDLRVMVGLARSYAMEPVMIVPDNRFPSSLSDRELVWLRTWERQLPKLSGPMLLEFSRLGRARVERVAHDSSVLLIDPQFPTTPDRASFFADPVHFSDSGASRLSRAAADSLETRLTCQRSSVRDEGHIRE
jgi:hypothetical protein